MRLRCGCPAAQQRIHHAPQQRRRYRLAEQHVPWPVALRGQREGGGQHDDGNAQRGPLGFQTAAQLQPVDARHHQVRDDGVRPLRGGERHCVDTVVRGEHAVPVDLEHEPQRAQEIPVVVYKQQRSHKPFHSWAVSPLQPRCRRRQVA
jgi:hypothetical protein